MEIFDQDSVDLLSEGSFIIQADGLDPFQFGAVEGRIDYRIEDYAGSKKLEFSWDGSDDMDPASGRGCAILEGDVLRGKIYFYLGDSSWFKAKRN